MTIRIDGTVHRGDLTLRLDLTIDAGRTAVIGPNGAGKTTLLRLIAGLEALDRGVVRIQDQVVDDGTRFVPAHERSTAVVFQEHRLFPHLKAVDNVAFPLRRQGIDRVAAAARAADALGLVGMEAHAGRRPSQLSGGQRQRIAIARALVARPDVLLLDEPLASIDDESRSAIRQCLMDAPSPIVVWVSHDPADTLEADSLMSFTNGVVSQTPRP